MQDGKFYLYEKKSAPIIYEKSLCLYHIVLRIIFATKKAPHLKYYSYLRSIPNIFLLIEVQSTVCITA